MKMLPQQYCLRWKHHHSNVQNMFAQLLEKERFCDVTLYCSPSFATQVPNKDTVEPHHIRGVSLRAHRVVLAACSELLGALLGAHEAQGEPVLVIDGAEPRHLRALLDYMYTGEMNVHHSQLASLLKTAEELRIKGLTDIRWNNKDEPPDCETGVVTAVPTQMKSDPKQATEKQQTPEKQPSPKPKSPKHSPVKSPKHAVLDIKAEMEELDIKPEKFTVNGGPPPLIKLPTKEKHSPPKREYSDSETPSPKRQRLASGTEHTDDESASHSLPERDSDWQHGNLDITAERVVGWGGGESGDWSRDPSDDEWADAPADIGSFLHTRLRVDGDNSADEESNDSAGGARSVSSLAASSSSAPDGKPDMAFLQQTTKPTVGPKSGPTDPRFTDVVKLTDYLQHGRRPQFWEEHYVKRVMEAVRMKELEMKQAAEILGVSYGTLYGRYRDVYGCINRPYRTARDFWQAKGPSEVLERLQRGDISVEAASLALGVSVNNLAAYMADFPQPHHEKAKGPSEVLERLQRGDISVEAASLALGVSVNNLAAYMADFPQPHHEKAKGPSEVLERLQRGDISVEAASLALGVSVNNLAAYMADFPQPHHEKEFEPIPIEIDPSLKMRPRTYSAGQAAKPPPRKLPDKSFPAKPMDSTLVAGEPFRKITPAGPAAATAEKQPKKIMIASLIDEDPIPATVITTTEAKVLTNVTTPTTAGSGKWPTIRVASLESLGGSAAPASPSALMRTRPDLTIVAAKRADTDSAETN
ncbi:hypothetical protein ABMA28_013003 [Loxostege sticticalis]|uniref:BTB domain-containing protein n=1 Tax=Loxostege sticticalis TaxID=481309 RepID=A0ABD0S5K2_LOXSC